MTAEEYLMQNVYKSHTNLPDVWLVSATTAFEYGEKRTKEVINKLADEDIESELEQIYTKIRSLCENELDVSVDSKTGKKYVELGIVHKMNEIYAESEDLTNKLIVKLKKRLEEATRWIPVEDKLPDSNKIVQTKYKKSGYVRYDHERYYKTRKCWSYNKPTHWRYIDGKEENK